MLPRVQVSAEGAPTDAPRTFTLEHHFKLTVDEGLVRAMALGQGTLVLPIVIGTPAPPDAGKAAKAKPKTKAKVGSCCAVYVSKAKAKVVSCCAVYV